MPRQQILPPLQAPLGSLANRIFNPPPAEKLEAAAEATAEAAATEPALEKAQSPSPDPSPAPKVAPDA
jgi:hypothetical protein